MHFIVKDSVITFDQYFMEPIDNLPRTFSNER